VGFYNFVEIIREKEYPFCVDDPVAGFIGAALPAYHRQGLPTISFFNQS
jgi:hypothetical protein